MAALGASDGGERPRQGLATAQALLRTAIEANASPKQLGSLGAALMRSCLSLPDLGQEASEHVLKRTAALKDALIVQEALAGVGVQHHHLSAAVGQATQRGVLPPAAGRAARSGCA